MTPRQRSFEAAKGRTLRWLAYALSLALGAGSALAALRSEAAPPAAEPAPLLSPLPRATHDTVDRDLQRLDGLRDAPDLHEMERFILEIRAKWAGPDRHVEYWVVLSTAARALSGMSFGPDLTVKKCRMAAALALELLRQTDLPLDLAVPLAPLVTAGDRCDQREPHRKTQPWPETRRARTRIWLQISSRLDRAIDPSFDFKKPVVLNHVLDGTGRARKAGSNDDRYVAARNAQHRLRALKSRFDPDLAHTLAWMYAQAPDDSADLQKQLLEFVKDAAERRRLMSLAHPPSAAGRR